MRRSHRVIRAALPLGWMACATPPVDKADDRAEQTDVVADTAPTDEGSEVTDTDLAPTDLPVTDTDRPDPTGLVVCFTGDGTASPPCLDVVSTDGLGSDYAYPVATSLQYSAPTAIFDLITLSPSLKLSPNFAVSEFLQAYKGEFGLLQPHTIDHMQAIRDAVGGPVFVNSGYRNPAYNASVGGAGRSRHMYGDAADMRSDDVDLVQLGELCTAEGAGYIGYYETHIHCDWRDDPVHPVLFAEGQPVVAHPPPEIQHAVLQPGVPWRAPAQGWDEGEPLREWTAYDADGHVLQAITARTFTPPAGTATVQVTVGRQITLTASAR